MTKIGRNAPCPCGSGLKYKRCCEEKDQIESQQDELLMTSAETALSNIVYVSVLTAIWTLFHPNGEQPPDLDVLEDFAIQIYGYPLDRHLLDDVVLPFPLRGLAALPMEGIDSPQSPEAPPPAISQTELFPDPAPPPE